MGQVECMHPCLFMCDDYMVVVNQLGSQPFSEASSLEAKLLTLLPVSRALIAGVQKVDEATVVSAYVLDKVGRYTTPPVT